VERDRDDRPYVAGRDAMNLHLGELPRLMLRWSLGQERWRAWWRLIIWGIPWGACTTLSLLSDDSSQFLFAGIAIGMGSTLGNRMLCLMPVQVRVEELFGRGTWWDDPFWLNIPVECGARRFAKHLRAYGGHSLIPRHRKALAWGLSRVGDLGTYPAILLRNTEFADAGVRAWVGERTGGALEMAHTLCTHPEVHTLHDLTRLIERLGRNTPQTPAP